MPRGDNSSYTDKQRRQAERRAWATMNKESGGGEKSASAKNAAATCKRHEARN